MSEIQRNPCDEATRELYKLLHCNSYKKVTTEDVQRCIDNGAMLTGIKSSYGIPLTCAIENRCDISIIKLLVKNGGIDHGKDSIVIRFMSESIVAIRAYYNIKPDPSRKNDDNYYAPYYLEYVFIRSLMNVLVKLYNYAIGSKKLENQIVQSYPGLKKKPFIPDMCEELKERHKERNNTLYNYLKQVCEVLKIDFSLLHDRLLDLPDDLTDFDSACQDDASYNWSSDIDGSSETSDDTFSNDPIDE